MGSREDAGIGRVRRDTAVSAERWGTELESQERGAGTARATKVLDVLG